MTTRPPGLRAAAYYIRRWGVRIVPTAPGTRRSVIGHTGPGHERASADGATIRDWWRRYPDAEAAILATDAVLLVDVDRKHGFDGSDTLDELQERYGELPEGPTSETPNGGEHRYFRAVEGIRSSTAKLGVAVDIRGAGSLLFPPPCRGYEYLIGYSAEDIELPRLPVRWVDALRRIEECRGEPGGAFRLPDVVGRGERNDTLFRYACSMRARRVPWELLVGAVKQANVERCNPPLRERELAAFLRSVERYPAGRLAA